jgi:drug/metabolite transporter (DMT)-like permease
MAVSMWAGFRATRHLTVIANMTIGKVTGITTILLGWTILGERLTTWQLIGGGILLVAAIMAIWAPAKNTAPTSKRLHASSIALALVACVALAVGLVTEKAILGHMQVGGVFLVGWTTQALAMVLLAAKDARPKALREFWGYELRWSALLGMVNGLTGVFYVYAIFHSDNISLITTLLAITSPLTVFGAYVLLHEREHHKVMWASLVVGFVGLLVSNIR